MWMTYNWLNPLRFVKYIVHRSTIVEPTNTLSMCVNNGVTINRKNGIKSPRFVNFVDVYSIYLAVQC